MQQSRQGSQQPAASSKRAAASSSSKQQPPAAVAAASGSQQQPASNQQKHKCATKRKQLQTVRSMPQTNEIQKLLSVFICPGFGPRLGGRLDPSWHQNLRNRGPKTMSKSHQKSGDASRRNGAAVVRPGTGSKPLRIPSGSQIQRSRGPRGSRDPSMP